ncbi:MAG TPA: hypothetical protein DFR83_12585 [Deltaproteobacteria bacterium]|nr:hypothetical protein [Deltaproteobacteria bacterium]
MSAYDALHQAACSAGNRTYRDPESGYRVFTALAHEARGSCCGFGCRHCPYGHSDVPAHRRGKPRDPFLLGSVPDCGHDVLFWSGGKDSYLALQALQAAQARPVVLLTTFEDRSEIVAQQQIHIKQIIEQREALGLPLLLVPLQPGPDYTTRLALALGLLSRRCSITRLVFGDLHLEHIRHWREVNLGPVARAYNATLHLPLWHTPYATLAAQLDAARIDCVVSAVDHQRVGGDVLQVGDAYNSALRARLPDSVDAFGENGEFHTMVRMQPQ